MTSEAPADGPPDQKPHFVLVPLMAQGHMIPMTEMAQLLAGCGTMVTFVTTPLNASRLKPIIDRIEQSGLLIQFLPLRFPCAEVGLPEGCENIDAVPTRDLIKNFLEGCAMLREPLLTHLRVQEPRPSCIITDTAHVWTREVARELGIPRFTFNGFGCFSHLCRHVLYHQKILDNISDENEPFVVPGLPHRIEVTKAQTPGNFAGPSINKHREKMMEAEAAADAVVVNSFDDLEPWYVESYQKAIGKKVWTIGPMCLYNRNVADMTVRGNQASDRCLSWLDSMKPGSVLYVSFGSLARTVPSQLIEIGLGLEASGSRFIWAIKTGDKSSDVEEWLLEGFEERIAARGFIIRGWAPQLAILSHPAIGGFMTHCGWNSVLESVSAGVPMITWPHFAEQFLNEKLIVEVLRIGVAVGVAMPTKWGAEDNETAVKSDEVEKVVRSLMDEGEEGEEMRERIRLLKEKAKKAMEEGSSSENLRLLVRGVQIT